MTIMARFTILRGDIDVGSSEFGGIDDRNTGNYNHDGTDDACVGMTFTRTLTMTFMRTLKILGCVAISDAFESFLG